MDWLNYQHIDKLNYKYLIIIGFNIIFETYIVFVKVANFNIVHWIFTGSCYNFKVRKEHAYKLSRLKILLNTNLENFQFLREKNYKITDLCNFNIVHWIFTGSCYNFKVRKEHAYKLSRLKIYLLLLVINRFSNTDSTAYSFKVRKLQILFCFWMLIFFIKYEAWGKVIWYQKLHNFVKHCQVICISLVTKSSIVLIHLITCQKDICLCIYKGNQ